MTGISCHVFIYFETDVEKGMALFFSVFSIFIYFENHSLFMVETIGGDEGNGSSWPLGTLLTVMSKDLIGVSYDTHEGESVLMSWLKWSEHCHTALRVGFEMNVLWQEERDWLWGLILDVYPLVNQCFQGKVTNRRRIIVWIYMSWSSLFWKNQILGKATERCVKSLATSCSHLPF